MLSVEKIERKKSLNDLNNVVNGFVIVASHVQRRNVACVQGVRFCEISICWHGNIPHNLCCKDVNG